MHEHYCDLIETDEEGFWYSWCKCGFKTENAPDLDIIIDMMMEHAMQMMQNFMIGNREEEK